MIVKIYDVTIFSVTCFNPSNHVPFRLQVVHDGDEFCGEIVKMLTRRLLLCRPDIPAFKARIIALIGPQEYMALFMELIASFMNLNSLYYNPDDFHRSCSETDPDINHRCDPAFAKSRYSEVNLRAKK